MRNILTICGKEIKSYFVSPIAYLLMALFGLIFGYFFYSATAYFVMAGLRQQMGGDADGEDGVDRQPQQDQDCADQFLDARAHAMTRSIQALRLATTSSRLVSFSISCRPSL